MCVCAAAFLICGGLLLWMHINENKVDDALKNAVIDTAPSPSVPVSPSPKPSPSPSPEPSETVSPSPEPSPEPVPAYEPADIPIDFEYLKSVNEDIYAWIDLQGLGLEYPVLQSIGDPDYYLHRDINGNYSSNGSLYTQYTFNTKTFGDACTVIYGHDMASGKMFGRLEPFTKGLDLDDEENEDNYFVIYTPTRKLTYRIACAGVYSNDNILYYHDFSKEDDFNEFFQKFSSFGVGTRNISETFKPEFGTETVVLLTCWKTNNYYRYLTVGCLVDVQGEPLHP